MLARCRHTQPYPLSMARAKEGRRKGERRAREGREKPVLRSIDGVFGGAGSFVEDGFWVLNLEK